ncbi:hypothetical protein YA0089_28395 [Pseudomonas viridiflava]|uniref:hypothetical protein n=1 Tax=Pseudomonas viridiflava TaxID=33069 RepID=UPI0018E5B14A|nr:hypothetical protein [Pseudomonas viridiflava]MBI6727539.1 hypothetical protein [Pseudomonas viridiflava]
MLTQAAKEKETPRGSFGVTSLSQITTYSRFSEHLERIFCDLTPKERKRCSAVSIIQSEILELHYDSGIGTGYLLMLEVPEGAELIQNGPSIYPKVGDVIQITYRFLHGLTMKQPHDRLIFAALDFGKSDPGSMDRWKARVTKFNSLANNHENALITLKASD